MRICLIEPAGDKETGSIGAFYIAEAARQAGHNVDIIAPETPRYHYDVELISVHHPNDYPRFKAIPKHGKIRIGGGHVTYNNPRPMIPLVDVLCLGDGEAWIKQAMRLLQNNKTAEQLAELGGTIISSKWDRASILPERNYISPLPDNPPYLNRPNTLSAAWYIEIARGCPYHCHYCELGNSMPYRYRPKVDIFEMLDNLDTLEARKVVFFAPDEASHPAYTGILEHARDLGLRQGFGSYRLDRILEMGGLPFAPNQLVRVGVDGMTEDTRYRVNKRIKDKQIVDYFRLMIGRGHVNFKIFQMFAYPWENPRADFPRFERVMSAVFSIPLNKPVSLRVKWTPLIPQPKTLLQDAGAVYHPETASLIRAWHKKVREPKSQPGWHIECDGIMSAKSHARQIELTHGDETLLLDGARYINPAWR